MEQILTFGTQAINHALRLQGAFLSGTSAEDITAEAVRLNKVFNCDPIYHFRDGVEKDPTRKQLLPYIAVQISGTDQVLVYIRKKGGEVRLDAKKSIGVGGHINHEFDATQESLLTADAGDCYRACVREIHEELGILSSDYFLSPVGWINDDSDPVGQVHFARLYVAKISEKTADSLAACSGEIYKNNAAIGFYSAQTLLRALGPESGYENWSNLFIRLLAKSNLF